METKKNSNSMIGILVVIIVILFALLFLIGTGMVSFKFNTDTSNQQTNKNTTIDNSQSSITNETNNNCISSNSNIISQKTSVSTSQILSYYKERISMYNDSNHQYSVMDINNDNIPELFIFITGTVENQIIDNTSIYTYDENKGDKLNNYILYIGNINGRISNNTVLYKMNDGRLLSVYGHMGYENAEYFKLENDWLIRTEFSSRKTDNYLSGDNEIQFKPCTDYSLIDNYN